MLRYALGQLKSNKFIKIMAVLVLSVLAIIFSMSLFISGAVFNFIAPRFYNPNAKIDVRVSATGGTNFISEDVLKDYGQYIEKITSTMDIYGLIGPEESSSVISIRGVNSKNVFFDEDYEIVDGSMFFQANQCVLPFKLAESLGAKVGDSVLVKCNKKTLNISVVGIYKGFEFFSSLQTIFVSDKTTSYFMYNSYSEGLYNTLNVQLNSSIKAQDFVNLLQESDNAAGMNIVLAKNTNQLNSALNMANIPSMACMIMIIFLVLFIVFALYYLDSIKQQKLIKVFRNTGASIKQIFSVFLGAHFLVGLIGGIIGSVLSCIVTFAITSAVGISVNIFQISALGFLMVLISNATISLISTALSIRAKKSKNENKAQKRLITIIFLTVIIITVLSFVLISIYVRQLLVLSIIKEFITIFAFCLMLFSICAIISFVYDIYKKLHIKIFSKSRIKSLWIASAGPLKTKQTKNFFTMLTTLIVVMVTTTSLLFFLQNTPNIPISSKGDSVLFCSNIKEKSSDKIYSVYQNYNAKIFWSGSAILNFTTDEYVSTYATILDKEIIEDLCQFNNPLTAEQLDYFGGDTIGIYYSDSRQSILLDKKGTVKTVITSHGNKELPVLGYLKESSYTMNDILINKATAEYLNLNNNIAYVKINDYNIDIVLAETKAELFGYGIVVEKQSEVMQKQKDANKPLGDMFNIVNYSLIFLLFFALLFYVVLISNYQKDNFAKLKAVGMSKKSLFISQIILVLPLCILAAFLGIAVSQCVRYCYNVIFRFMAVGFVRVYSNFVFFALPFIVAAAGFAIYLFAHYLVIRKEKSVRIDLER